MFFFQAANMTRYSKLLSYSVFHPSTWGEQQADRQWTYCGVATDR